MATAKPAVDSKLPYRVYGLRHQLAHGTLR